MEMIKLSLPHIGTTEIEWVNKAFVGDWVVPLGPNVDEFERRLENYVGDNKEVVALSAVQPRCTSDWSCSESKPATK